MPERMDYYRLRQQRLPPLYWEGLDPSIHPIIKEILLFLRDGYQENRMPVRERLPKIEEQLEEIQKCVEGCPVWAAYGEGGNRAFNDEVRKFIVTAKCGRQAENLFAYSEQIFDMEDFFTRALGFAGGKNLSRFHHRGPRDFAARRVVREWIDEKLESLERFRNIGSSEKPY